MDYEAAIAYITQFIDYERSPDFSRQARRYNLNRIVSLLDLLGNPQAQLRVVHIAGSKGKGSTAALIASILRCAGYKTGLFTSPHLISPRERCRIDEELISKADIARYIEKLKPAIDTVSGSEWGRVSFFEIYTAMAFCYFADEGTDFAVIEVGLGGRLDATNVVKPAVTVITPISLEHTAILGKTYPEIAAEKAEIIKTGCPLALAPQPAEAEAVFVKRATERNAPIVRAGTIRNHNVLIGVRQQKDRDIDPNALENRGGASASDHPGQRFSLKTESDNYPALFIPLLGEYQLVNAATAIAGIECLKQIGYAVPRESIYHGIAEVKWPGRMQVISISWGNEEQDNARQQRDTPRFLLDGAHSPESVGLLCEQIRRNFRYNRLIFIVSLMQDKAIREIGAIIGQNADIVIVTEVSDNPRVMSASRLKEVWSELCEEIWVCLPPQVALTTALSAASSGDLICVTGSLYLVGECLDFMDKRKAEKQKKDKKFNV